MKKILVICTAFSPENAIGSIRNTKLVKYLVQDGFDITVISPKVASNAKVDSTLASEELNQINFINIPYSKLFTKLFLAKRNEIITQNSRTGISKNSCPDLIIKIKSVVYRILQELYTILRNQDWKHEVLEYLSKHKEINGYDYVFTGYPSLSAHLLGEFVLEKKIANKWIADFRDPIAYKSLNSRFFYWLNTKLQQRFCQKANAVTCITNEMVHDLARGIVNKNKFFNLPNGFDEDDLEAIKKSNIDIQQYKDFFKISYVGSLYRGKRDLSILFKTIKLLSDQKVIEIDKVKFFYAGKELSFLIAQAQKYMVESIIINMGFVSREDSLSIQNQSDLIIVNTWNTEEEQGILTGKVYECLLLKKPTLAIINGTVPNSSLGNMIIKAGIGFVYDTMTEKPEAYQQMSEFVVSLYKAAIDNSPIELPLNLEYIKQYN